MSCLASDVCIRKSTRLSCGRLLLHLGLLVLFIDLLACLFFEGLHLRRLGWEMTRQVRFSYDIGRNYNLGREALRDGWLNIYENQVTHPRSEEQKINYTPLRLAVFEAWAAWNKSHLEKSEQWQPEYEFNAFLMRFNNVCEFLAAVAAFLLVRHWVRRTWRPKRELLPLEAKPRPGPWVGVVRATIAACLIWFSPAMIIMSHGWPSPNAWVIPWFLWTVLLCSWEKWLLAGIVIGIGAMFQGQQLFVAPIFILWPIFAGQPGRAFRWAAGFLLGFMNIASGWMLTTRPNPELPQRLLNWDAIYWITASMALVALVALRPRRLELSSERLARISQDAASASALRRFIAWSGSCCRATFALTAQQNRFKHPLTWISLLAAVIAIPMMARPLYHGDFSPLLKQTSVLAALAIVLFAWLAPRRWSRYLLAAMLGAGLLLCIPVFHASTAWWDLGFMYGTERHPELSVGAANNLGAILRTFGWRDLEETFEIPARFFWVFPAQTQTFHIGNFLFGTYAVFLVASCIALALQWRRNDRNFLIAMVTPWILFYTIPAQMHERYLLFAAGAGACVIGCSVGMTLLDIGFIILTYIQTATSMMGTNRIGPGGFDLPGHPLFGYDVARQYRLLQPDISYAVVLACIIFFYVSFTRYRRIKKVKPAPVLA